MDSVEVSSVTEEGVAEIPAECKPEENSKNSTETACGATVPTEIANNQQGDLESNSDKSEVLQKTIPHSLVPGNHCVEGNIAVSDVINVPNNSGTDIAQNDEKETVQMECEILQSVNQSDHLIEENQHRNTVLNKDTPTTVEPETMIVQEQSGPECSVSEEYVSENATAETQHSAVPIEAQPNILPDPELIAQKQDICENDEALSPPSQSAQSSGLTLLAAQYDSDSDDVCEVPTTQSYQNRFVEIDSDSSSDVEILSEACSPIDLGILGAGHGEEDDEENLRNSRSPKVKGELHLDDLPPIHDLHITVPEEECTELGKIQSIIEQLVVVNSLPGTVPLDLDTVLFLDKGKQVLGEIFDVLGQVSDPLYCVRFNSNKDVKGKGIEVGQTVYVAPRTQHTQFIVLANLMKVRGSDASWENDIEPPEKHLDYSDDEEERTARRSIRNKSRPMDADDEQPKRQRPSESPNPNFGVYSPQRPYRGNYYGPVSRPPNYPPANNYNIAGNSWHSNFYPNYVQPQHQHQQYQMPVHPPGCYRAPPRNMSHRGAPTHPGLVLNPYAVFPPPQLMQQPLFPPPPQQPPPPPGSF